MKKCTIEDICSFAARTGDTVIVIRDGEAFVIQKFDDYKKMIESREDIGSLSEDEMLAKMNREIALWKSRQMTEALDSMDDRDILDEPFVREQNSCKIEAKRADRDALPMAG